MQTIEIAQTYTHQCMAYLDGGSGSMLIQAAFAGVLAGAYTLKTVFANLRARFLGAKHSNAVNKTL